MIERIIVRPSAVEDVVEAAGWYEDKRRDWARIWSTRLCVRFVGPPPILNFSASFVATERLAESSRSDFPIESSSRSSKASSTSTRSSTERSTIVDGSNEPKSPISAFLHVNGKPLVEITPRLTGYYEVHRDHTSQCSLQLPFLCWDSLSCY